MDSKKLANYLQKNFNFFSGVPDSLLSKLTKRLNSKKIKHFIAANEGSAIAHGIGYYLAKKKVPCVYFQNSGLGNAINPLISIAHKKVYSIPLFLIIGWRGSPNSLDEPQHMVKGEITLKILKLMGIKYLILKKKDNLQHLKKLIKFSKKNNQPVACIIKNEILSDINKNKNLSLYSKGIKRIDFIKYLINETDKKTKFISTTGYTSRELYYLRKNKFKYQGNDFYMVGGMGHSASVATSYTSFTKKNVICLDGDGSLIMHLGSLVSCSAYLKNFKYILLNNNSHESVGGQTTNAQFINFKRLSKSLGFTNYLKLENQNDIKNKIKKFLNLKRKVFLEVKIKTGSIKNLIRPKNFLKIKKDFLTY